MTMRSKQMRGYLGNAAVYQEGGTKDLNLHVYTTFQEALSAAQALQPLDPVVIIDGSMGSPVVPAGNYILSGGVTLTAKVGTTTTLTVQDNAVFTGLANTGIRITGGLHLHSLATSQSPAQPTGAFQVIIDQHSRISTDAASTKPFFDTHGSYQIFLEDWSAIAGGADAAPVFNLTLGVAGHVYVGDSDASLGAAIAAHSLGGDANGWFVHMASAPSSQVFLPQPSAGVSVTPALRTTQFFTVDVQLTNGTATVATGQNMTNATLLGVSLKTPNTAVGEPRVTFLADGHVTVTSFDPAGVQLATDQSTYTCVFAGAVG